MIRALRVCNVSGNMSMEIIRASYEPTKNLATSSHKRPHEKGATGGTKIEPTARHGSGERMFSLLEQRFYGFEERNFVEVFLDGFVEGFVVANRRGG